MKKLVSGVIISALVITAGTASAFAYHGRKNQTYKLNKTINYVDLNNDGVCDNMGTCPKDGTGRQLGKHR